MTRTIDPEMVQDFFQKDSPSAIQSKNEEPFIRDKNAIFSLEVKF
jgi:hypothetical protein